MKLVIALSALNDLKEIQAFYLEKGVPEVGQKFASTILAKAQKLTDHPDSGRILPEFNQEQIREIIYPPFRIVYLRETTTINLVRVWRSERLMLLPE